MPLSLLERKSEPGFAGFQDLQDDSMDFKKRGHSRKSGGLHPQA